MLESSISNYRYMKLGKIFENSNFFFAIINKKSTKDIKSKKIFCNHKSKTKIKFKKYKIIRNLFIEI